MNKDKIIQKFKTKKEEQIFILKDGGVVVGEEVDEENRLHYVIRRGKNYTIESAWNQPIKQRFLKLTHYTKTVNAKGEIKVETIQKPQ